MRKSVLAGVGLAALVALPPAVAQTQPAAPWIHVRVEEAKNASRVHVNLPLTVVQAVLEATPELIESQGKIHLGKDHGLKIEDVRRIWKQVEAAGDAELVSVEDGDETVKVWRKGDQIHVRVEDQGKEEVVVEVPVSLVDAALSGEGDTVNVKAAIAELQKKRGDIVSVKDEDATVRVCIDEQNAQTK
jgi:hypothetical protein